MQRDRSIVRVLGFALAVLTAAVATPADTQPRQQAPAEWTRTVEAIRNAIVAADTRRLSEVCGDEVVVRTLSGEPRRSAAAAAVAAIRSTPLACHAYVFPAATIASDLAAAASEVEVPGPLSRALALESIHAASEADDIARRWIERVLPVDSGDLLGVIAFVPPAGSPAEVASPLLVVVRGVATEKGLVVTHLSFGMP